MKNLRELFSLYHAGFQDFGPWLDHHIEMHRRRPLECAEFGAEWLRRWEAVGRLLEAPARLEWCLRKTWHHWHSGTVFDMIRMVPSAAAMCPMKPNEKRRMVLLDGTVIREWGLK